MAILGLGVDLVEIERFEKLSRRFLERVYTEYELGYISKKSNKAQSLAVRFAAKEAVIKAFGWRLFGQDLKDISVRNEASGKPYIELSGKAKKRAESQGVTQILLSLSHTKTTALAEVIIVGGDKS